MSRDDFTTPAGLRRAVAVTRLVLGWERLWLALWRAACVLGGFVALALLDVLPRLPGWLHAGLLVAVVAALVLAVRRGFRGFRWPAEAEAVRRLERDNGLAHRPLSALRDRPATGDGEQAAVWRRHIQEMIGRIGRLRVPLPRPGLAAVDPLGARAVVGLVLVAIAAGSWGDWLPRLAAAVRPHLTSPGLGAPAMLDAWLVPPDYTGAAPIFLQRAGSGPEVRPAAVADSATPIPVPVGSTILARVSGGSGLPTLTVNDHEVPFSAVDDSHFQAQDTVRAGSTLTIGQGGRTLGQWAIAVLPDRPPRVAFATPPSALPDGAVHLDYTASDEYGLAAVTATVRPDPKTAAVAGIGAGTPSSLVLPLPLPGLRPKTVHGTSNHDLTASPWAGLPVLIRLTATDGSGHTGTSEEVPLVLPERVFTNPVAQKIMAERKALALGGDAARRASAQALSELSVRPGAYHQDLVVFLALRVAVAQLLLDQDATAIPAVRDVLWETALRLEDGGVSLAGRDLHDAQAALAAALDRKAGDDELRRRMDDLQVALDHFLDALDEQGSPQATAGGAAAMPPGAAPLVLERADLEAMMRSLRDMTETGARDGARQALADLGRLLDGLKTGATTPDPNQGATLEALHRLQDLTARQRDLLDQTFRRSQDQPPASDSEEAARPTPADTRQAADQEALRRQLGAVMQQLGETNGDIPRPLGEAERAMHEAGQALREGDPEAAATAGTEAVDRLQQGVSTLGRMLGLMGAVGGGAASGAGRDPLGRLRPGVGTAESSDVGLPEAPELQKAREILDELRRRAGQRERSHEELDYIDRLLRPF
jgi:uncharacterized protein (TIGR02302 family)